MNLPLFIAGRYLFAKKSHNVINIISAISAIGMARSEEPSCRERV